MLDTSGCVITDAIWKRIWIMLMHISVRVLVSSRTPPLPPLFFLLECFCILSLQHLRQRLKFAPENSSDSWDTDPKGGSQFGDGPNIWLFFSQSSEVVHFMACQSLLWSPQLVSMFHSFSLLLPILTFGPGSVRTSHVDMHVKNKNKQKKNYSYMINYYCLPLIFVFTCKSGIPSQAAA